MLRGVEGGFTQANHGSARMLKQVQKGDCIVFYSPKETYEGNVTLQAFTAIGQVIDDEPYQQQMSEDFHPFRRKVRFVACTETPIRPLLDGLDFITDKQHWGYAFRRGMFAVSHQDFLFIARHMVAADRLDVLLRS